MERYRKREREGEEQMISVENKIQKWLLAMFLCCRRIFEILDMDNG